MVVSCACVMVVFVPWLCLCHGCDLCLCHGCVCVMVVSCACVMIVFVS